MHFDQALAHASPQISVGESEVDPQLPCERTLCECVVPLDNASTLSTIPGLPTSSTSPCFPTPIVPVSRCVILPRSLAERQP